MQITKVEFFKTPFNDSYSDVMDRTDMSFYYIFTTTFPHVSFSAPTDFTVKAVNESNFSASIKFTMAQKIIDVMEYNYCIINGNRFYFITSCSNSNAITGIVTYTFNLTVDIWTTYYDKIAGSDNYVNKNILVSKFHQKLGTIETVDDTKYLYVDKDFKCPQGATNVSKLREINSFNDVLWLRIDLKRIVDADVYYKCDCVSNDEQDSYESDYFGSYLFPYVASPTIYYPVAYYNTDNYSSLFRKYALAYRTRNGHVYSTMRAENALGAATYGMSYVESMHLTYSVPFPYTVEIPTNPDTDYIEVKVDKTYLDIGNLNYVNTNTHEDYVLFEGCVMFTVYADGTIWLDPKTYETDAKSTYILSNNTHFPLSFDPSQLAVLNENRIKELSVHLKTYPIVQEGFIFDGKYLPISKYYVGNHNEQYKLYTLTTDDGIRLSVDVTNNNIVYENARYNVEANSCGNVIPFSEGQQSAYIIANGNSLTEARRWNNDERLNMQTNVIAGTIGAVGDAVTAAATMGVSSMAGASSATTTTGNRVVNSATDSVSASSSSGANIGVSSAGIISGAASRIAQVLNEDRRYNHVNRQLDAQMNDKANMPSMSKSSGSGGLVNSYISERVFKFKDKILDDYKAENTAFDEYFNGTDINIIRNPFTNVRECYDYIRTNEDLKCSNIAPSALAIFNTILNNGTRKWHFENIIKTHSSVLLNYAKNLNLRIRNLDYVGG